MPDIAAAPPCPEETALRSGRVFKQGIAKPAFLPYLRATKTPFGNDMSSQLHTRGNPTALLPLLFFLALYLATSAVAGDFYRMPISVAFAAASVVAVAIMRGRRLAERIECFSAGAADPNIMLMIWIFILAGAFAQSARTMGAVDATVALTLHLLPQRMLGAGFFLAACFVSISVGTSVGTIVALVPVASALSAQTGIDSAWLTAAVVGGAFFGDNLSFISDTTIAATRTQECELRDKFRVNVRIVAPAALLTLLVYVLTGGAHPAAVPAQAEIEWTKVIPYVIVLLTAVMGVNVMSVLILGILSTGIIGIATGGLGLFDLCREAGAGIAGMGELIIITLLAGGMLETIRRNGGIDYIIDRLTSRIAGRRGAEGCIAALVCMANVCTANNTIAIITVGSIARSVADRFGVDRRKSASLLDTFSCFTQGMLPYGAQILMAAGLSGLSPLEIIGYLYYPMIMGVFAVLSIIFGYPKLGAGGTEED